MCSETPEVSGMISISDKMEVRKACDTVLRGLTSLGYGDRDQFAVRLAVEEAATNAIIHGNKEDPDKKTRIDYAVYKDRVSITVTDEGEGFDYTTVANCTDPDHVMRTGGRGVCLIKEFMDEISPNENGNSLTMVRFRGSCKGKGAQK